MARFTPIFYIKLGDENVANMYVEESPGVWHSIVSHEYFKINKSINSISYFEAKCVDVGDDEKSWLKVNSNVIFTSGNSVLLRGVIKKIKYSSKYECTISGGGEELKLLEKAFTKNGSHIYAYNNISAQDIFKDILSVNSDGEEPYIVDISNEGIFAEDPIETSIKFENTNKLNTLNNLCTVLDYEWWITVDDVDYDILKFNIDKYSPSYERAITSQGIFSVTGINQNCESTNIQYDESLLANDITFLGCGNGVNQLKTRVYNASASYSFLKSDCSETDNQITVEDGSSFAPSGEIRIGDEIINYTSIFGDTFIGCDRGKKGTTPRLHRKGVFVEKNVDINYPEVGSSIAINGHTSDTISDTSITNLETLEVLASTELRNRMSSVVNIGVSLLDPIDECEKYQLGDLITIIDEESSVNGDYRIVEIDYKSEYGFVTASFGCSNKTMTLTEKLQIEKNRLDSLSQTNQGSLNIWSDTQTMNTDSTHPLILTLNIPENIVDSSNENKANKILLSYSCKDYRTYSGELTGSTGDAYTGAGMTNSAAYTGAGISNSAAFSGVDISNASAFSGVDISNASAFSGVDISNAAAYSGAAISNVAAYTLAGISNASAYSGAGISNSSAYTNAGISNEYAGSSDSGYISPLYTEYYPTIDSDWHDCSQSCTLDDIPYMFHNILIHITITISENAGYNPYICYVMFRAKNLRPGPHPFGHITYFPSEYGMTLLDPFYQRNLSGKVFGLSTNFLIPYNWSSDTYVLQYCVFISPSAGVDDVYIQYQYVGIEGHIHNNSFSDATHTNLNTFSDSTHTNLNTFSDAEHTNPNTFSDKEHTNLNSITDEEHTNLNTISDSEHTNVNSITDAEHTNLNTFSDQEHTNLNSFNDEEHSNPAGTLASGYELGEEASDATNTIIKIYDENKELVWDSGNRNEVSEQDIDITEYVKNPGWYTVEIQPNGLAMVYGTVSIMAGVS